MTTLKEKVVYQIYPRSFQDSNGDGVGDINGIRSRLSYLKTLGVDIVWLTPIYPSGGRDNGYDIKDYLAIDPVFGTMEDFEALVKEAKQLDLGIMMDMVLNHTSTLHPWFQKALKNDAYYKDYYIFKDQPTNWESKFGGNAWTFVPELNQYYLHLFDVMQADLNWENPAVRQEMETIVNFWLDKGVEGLRFDVINLISKPDVFQDVSIGDGRDQYTDGPKVHQYLRALNQATFGNRDIITVGELSSTHLDQAVLYANRDQQELSTVFGFHHLKIDYDQGQKWKLKAPDLNELKQILRHWQEGMQAQDSVMALFWCNHDQPRSISRLGDDLNYPYESATMIATMMHGLRGMPYIYQGEEIGLPNAYFTTLEQFKDIESINYAQILKETHSDADVLKILQARSRDNGRTPIPWNHDKNYGFSQGIPWINFSQHPHLQSVEDDLANPCSIFEWYQKLIALRHGHLVLSEGSIEFIDLELAPCFNYIRKDAQNRWLIINNLTNEKVPYTLTDETIILSNYHRSTLKDFTHLQPYESLILSLSPEPVL